MEFARLLTLTVSSFLCVNVVSPSKVALIIIDVQNCFLPGGSLAVNEGDHVIPLINNIRLKYESQFSLVVLSQDWHCSDHVSFASQHRNANATILLQYDTKGKLCTQNNTCEEVAYNVTQVLWPDHCVINTTSAEFSSELDHKSTDVVVKKGYDCEVDSYSAFYDNGGFRQTELHSVLRNAGIDTVIITGIALDYCVYYTALDAQKLAYRTYVVSDATRPVSRTTGDAAVSDMRSKGINIMESKDLPKQLQDLTSGASKIQKLSSMAELLRIITAFVLMNNHMVK